MGNTLLGLNLEARDFHFYHLLLRSLIIFFALLAMVRLAGRRFLANRNPLDVLMTFILASMLSRAINGSAPFFHTLGAGFFLAALYRGVAYLACRFHPFGRFLKGRPEAVVRDGNIIKKNLDRYHVSEHDLLEDLRLNAHVGEITQVKLAQIERNGAISVLKKS
jgi:uncharacterized membrane protein YcaP (DUF421 family)